MDDKSPPMDPQSAAYQAALAEERVLWRALGDSESNPIEWVKAYARWRVAAGRVKALAPSEKPEGTQ